MNELSPNDVRSPEDLDDVLATIGTLGIDVLERQPKLPSSVLKRKSEEEVEPGGGLGLDLVPGAVEQTDDPVRIYLREMGVVPLLTREGLRRSCRTASRSPRAASTSCRSITRELASWPDGYRPFRLKRKHANTAAADAGWAARSFGFRSSSATSVSRT